MICLFINILLLVRHKCSKFSKGITTKKFENHWLTVLVGYSQPLVDITCIKKLYILDEDLDIFHQSAQWLAKNVMFHNQLHNTFSTSLHTCFCKMYICDYVEIGIWILLHAGCNFFLYIYVWRLWWETMCLTIEALVWASINWHEYGTPNNCLASSLFSPG